MSNIGDNLKELHLNREERRKMQRDVAKDTGKRKEDITVQDIIAHVSDKRKKNNRKNNRRK